MNFDNFECKEIDRKATTARLRNICRNYVRLLPVRKAGKASSNEMELMEELERVYKLLPEYERSLLSNWVEPKTVAKTDIALYMDMEMDEKFFYREKSKAIELFATMLGVEVYK